MEKFFQGVNVSQDNFYMANQGNNLQIQSKMQVEMKFLFVTLTTMNIF